MFDDTQMYLTGAPALLAIGPYQTLAKWRHERRGPAFYKIGTKVVYRGSDLNAWLEAQRVPTRDQPAGEAA